MDFYLICGLGFVVSLALVFIIMPMFIKTLVNHHISQSVSEYALEEYKLKQKTPIMGGLLFVVIPTAVFYAVDLFAVKDSKITFIVLSFLLYCLVGFIDDFLIIVRKNNSGLSPLFKLILEFIFAGALIFMYKDICSTVIRIPYFGFTFELGYFYYPLAVLMYMALCNAVNFTDGMDGLCAGVSSIGLLAFIVFALLAKEFNIVILIVCIMGGLFAYLYFNFHPAKIFMGDSGSLALGGLFASLSVVLNKEIAMFFIGGIFVWEMFCVCLQQLSVRLFHKRIFSYTPIHYSFTLKGMKEEKVVTMFYKIAFVCMILGLVIGLF